MALYKCCIIIIIIIIYSTKCCNILSYRQSVRRWLSRILWRFAAINCH